MNAPIKPGDITCEWLESVFSTKIAHFELEKGSEEGENFMCNLTRVAVQTKEGKTINVIIKFSPSDSQKLDGFKELKMFEKEYKSYTELITQFNELQRAKLGDVMFKVPMPQCYFAQENEDGSGVMVFEDMKFSGYTLPDKCAGLSYNEAFVTLKELAKFHAFGYALKLSSGGADGLLKKFPWLQNVNSTSETLRNYLNSSFDAVLKELEKIPGHKNTINRLKIFSFTKSIADRCFELDSVKEPLSVPCHGDFWANNILFSYDSNEAVRGCKLIDFQMCRYTRATIDIVYFIFSSLNSSVREKHLQELLKNYFDHLTYILHKLNVFLPPSYTFEKFLDDFNSTLEYGFVVAGTEIPMMFGSEHESLMRAKLLENIQALMNAGIF